MSKKRKTALQKRRTIAAKKGWATRRLRALPAVARVERKLTDNARIVVGKKPRKRPDRRRKGANPRIGESKDETIERLQREIAYERSERIALEETKNFVHTKKPEFLHEDWTLAVMPSRLRHRAETAEIRKALLKAEKRGEAFTEEFYRQIAEFYDVEVQEVYTLRWSP